MQVQHQILFKVCAFPVLLATPVLIPDSPLNHAPQEPTSCKESTHSVLFAHKDILVQVKSYCLFSVLLSLMLP